jgi:hypothetical protein
MGLTINDLEIGQFYYYGNCIRKFKCLEVREVKSLFKDYKRMEYEFHNHEMYKFKKSVL